MPARIVSWNCQGACERRVFADNLKRARALRADVVCLQEHKWRTRQNLDMARACARVAGWALFVQPDETGPRGGAAVLVREGSSVIGAVDTPAYKLNGRFVAVPAEVDGEATRIVCMYVPQDSRQRLVFRSSVK